VRQAQPAEGAAPKGNTGGSLEAYFDHLDAAFASGSPQASPAVTTAAPATSARSNDPFADWDPDLHGDPARPAPPPPVAFPQRASAPDPRPSSPAPTAIPPSQRPPIDFAQGKPASQAAPPPLAAPLPASLVDAFTALLEAEQKIGLKPSAAGMSSSTGGGATGPAVTEDLIEEVSRRVLARLTDQSRPVFLDVAERMVREEIERLRQS
jgi:hypothetical protein